MLILGMNFSYLRSSSCSRRKLPYPDRLRYAQVGESLEDRCPDVGFVHLDLEGSGGETVAQSLQAVHHVRGDAAPLVAAIVLPAGESLGLDFLEDGGAWDGRLPM